MYGRQVLGVVGSTYQVSADGNPIAKIGGCTIDWTTVGAVSGSDVTVGDGQVIKVGSKYLRYGQIICKITATGYYGPWDIAASDGRQLLARGDCYIVNRTILNGDPKDDYPEAIDGGRIWMARVIQSGVATHTLALGPTLAEFLAAFPRVSPVNEAS